MKSLNRITLLATVIVFGLIVLLTPTVSNAEDSATESAQPSANCIATDVKGNFTYTGNHLSGNPIKAFFENVGTNPNCNSTVYVHIFGSNIAPESDGWFESQSHVATQTYTVANGTSQNVDITLPTSDYCWYQVDATRTSEVRIPPRYFGEDMIDYVFVENKNCNEVTPTPTATPSATPTPTNGPTSTPTPNNSTTTTNETKTVESIKATLGTSTMAPTGGIMDFFMNGMFGTGMIVSALGALSYAKDKKARASF